METFKRYSMSMCDMAKHNPPRWIASRSKNVSQKFLDTPSRRKMRFVIRIFGVLFFAMTAMALLGSLLVMFLGEHLPKSMTDDYAPLAGLAILNFFNVLGMLVELASDSSGINWFAKGFLISIIGFFGGYLILTVIHFS